MKNVFAVVMTAALYFSGFSQTTYKEAKALITRASEKMKSYDKLYIDFTYHFENPRVEPPITQEEKGSIAVKGDNYHLNFMGTEQIRDGQKVYTILKADEEVQVTDYEESEDGGGLTPTRMLDLYKKGYSYKLGGAEKVNGRTIQYVILKPNASEQIDKIVVGIDKGSSEIYNLKQWGTNGAITTFTVDKFDPAKSLPAGYFSFDKADYPGYYIAR